MLRTALLDGSSTKVGHNLLMFDKPRLEKALDIKFAGAAFDTMLAHAVVQPDLGYREGSPPGSGHSLGAIAFSCGWDGEPPKGDKSDLEKYCSRDCDVTMRAFEKLNGELETLDLYPTLYRMQRAAPVVVKMRDWGVGVDLEQQARVRLVIEAETTQADEEVNRLIEELPTRRAVKEEAKRLAVEAALAVAVAVSEGKPFKMLTKRAGKLREAVGGAGRINLASSQQLKALLFEELGLPKQRSRSSKVEGALSTNEDALIELMRRCADDKFERGLPIIEALLRHREAAANTKYVGFAERVVHPDWVMHTTATGRMACLGVFQTTPKRNEKWAKLIRPMFGPVVEGNEITQADYSQIERRLQAVLSGDEAMLASFAAGVDCHSYTASLVLGRTPTKAERDLYKSGTYLSGYGGEWKKLQLELAKLGKSVSIDEAKCIIDGLKRSFPRYYAYCDELVAQAKKQQCLRTPLGRLRWFLGPAHGDAMNFPCQGTVADMMYDAMCRVDAALPQGAGLVAQVHDDLKVEHTPGQRAEVQAVLREAMEKPVSELGGWFCPVEVKSGKDWGMSDG
jgi:DNA polymerase I-like protein with 3'-5' exonuclease and polymerase domains